nr:MAG TPA: hypothetical protein [Caudoviricetes sp.]
MKYSNIKSISNSVSPTVSPTQFLTFRRANYNHTLSILPTRRLSDFKQPPKQFHQQ